ncbi:hypothetical protein [Spiroplasma endosymbiont of Virgichneumon dumeticola]|uniref:hypothetical protein n=1 Tax=Spiroplasma endosymbiont of Virgichneumon dumeticola TaxID=3139323 RepID=UPI0035C91DC6
MFKKDGVISLIDYFNMTIMVNYLNLEKTKSQKKIDKNLKFEIENVMLDLRSLFLQLEGLVKTINTNKTQIIFKKAFLPLCTIFKFYHINAEKSLSTDFSPHF